MVLIDALASAVAADPALVAMIYVLGAIAMHLVMLEHPAPDSTAWGRVLISSWWWLVVPIIVVSRVLALLVVERKKG